MSLSLQTEDSTSLIHSILKPHVTLLPVFLFAFSSYTSTSYKISYRTKHCTERRKEQHTEYQTELRMSRPNYRFRLMFCSSVGTMFRSIRSLRNLDSNIKSQFNNSKYTYVKILLVEIDILKWIYSKVFTNNIFRIFFNVFVVGITLK